jgi:hypothetical protein
VRHPWDVIARTPTLRVIVSMAVLATPIAHRL